MKSNMIVYKTLSHITPDEIDENGILTIPFDIDYLGEYILGNPFTGKSSPGLLKLKTLCVSNVFTRPIKIDGGGDLVYIASPFRGCDNLQDVYVTDPRIQDVAFNLYSLAFTGLKSGKVKIHLPKAIYEETLQTYEKLLKNPENFQCPKIELIKWEPNLEEGTVRAL